jgi:hypothetical protein
MSKQSERRKRKSDRRQKHLGAPGGKERRKGDRRAQAEELAWILHFFSPIVAMTFLPTIFSTSAGVILASNTLALFYGINAIIYRNEQVKLIVYSILVILMFFIGFSISKEIELKNMMTSDKMSLYGERGFGGAPKTTGLPYYNPKQNEY